MDRSVWKKIVGYSALIVAVSLMLYYYKEIYYGCRGGLSFCSDREKMNDFIESFGAYAPLAFIGLQVLQVLLAPVPGELTGFIGGYLFGIGPGVVISTIGLTIGSSLAFLIARRLGLPFVRRFVGEEIMGKFDSLMERQGAFFSFFFFLIPGLPKDYFCYLLGLSPMHLVTFLIISTVGRLPGTLLLTMQGHSIRDEHYRMFFVIMGLALVLFVFTFIYRDRIEKILKIKKIGRKRGESLDRSRHF